MAYIFKHSISSFTVGILVVTGAGRSSEKTQLWAKPDSQCTLADFPLPVTGAVGFWTAQGPTVCGGWRSGIGSINKCFIYKHNQWMPWTNMRTARWLASALQINPNQALIIGGRDENGNQLKTTEVISSSGSEEGNQFPVDISFHCSFKINATHAMVTGGDQDKDTYRQYSSYSDRTWFVDLTTTKVTPGPPMMTGRESHSCSIFQYGTKSYGIVAGGKNGHDDWDSCSSMTEMIDFNDFLPKWFAGIQG